MLVASSGASGAGERKKKGDHKGRSKSEKRVARAARAARAAEKAQNQHQPVQAFVTPSAFLSPASRASLGLHRVSDIHQTASFVTYRGEQKTENHGGAQAEFWTGNPVSRDWSSIHHAGVSPRTPTSPAAWNGLGECGLVSPSEVFGFTGGSTGAAIPAQTPRTTLGQVVRTSPKVSGSMRAGLVRPAQSRTHQETVASATIQRGFQELQQLQQQQQLQQVSYARQLQQPEQRDHSNLEAQSNFAQLCDKTSSWAKSTATACETMRLLDGQITTSVEDGNYVERHTRVLWGEIKAIDARELTDQHTVVHQETKDGEVVVGPPRMQRVQEVVQREVRVQEPRVTVEEREEVQRVKERVIEVRKPVIQEKVVEVEELEITENVYEFPYKITQEKVVEVQDVTEAVVKTERVKEVVQEKIVEVPDIEVKEVEVVREVEFPDLREELEVEEVPVPQFVDRPVPQIETKRIEQTFKRLVPLPIEATTECVFKIPRIRATYEKVQIPVYVPQFREYPVASDRLSTEQRTQLTELASSVANLASTAASSSISLCELERVGVAVRHAEACIQSVSEKEQAERMQSYFTSAWKSGKLEVRARIQSVGYSHRPSGIYSEPPSLQNDLNAVAARPRGAQRDGGFHRQVYSSCTPRDSRETPRSPPPVRRRYRRHSDTSSTILESQDRVYDRRRRHSFGTTSVGSAADLPRL